MLSCAIGQWNEGKVINIRTKFPLVYARNPVCVQVTGEIRNAIFERKKWNVNLRVVIILNKALFINRKWIFHRRRRKPQGIGTEQFTNRKWKLHVKRDVTRYLIFPQGRLDFRRFLESGLRSSPRRVRGRSAGSFPEQRLVIEPTKSQAPVGRALHRCHRGHGFEPH